MLWIDYFRERDTTQKHGRKQPYLLWIDYFRERDTTRGTEANGSDKLWIDYFRERDTTLLPSSALLCRCGLITLGNEIQLECTLNSCISSCGLITLGNEIQHQGAPQQSLLVVD